MTASLATKLLESSTKTIKVARKLVIDLLYPDGGLIYGGTDPILGDWVLSGYTYTLNTPTKIPSKPGAISFEFATGGVKVTFPLEKEGGSSAVPSPGQVG